MTSLTPDPPDSDTDTVVVELAEIESAPLERQQWRSMLPAAVIGTAGLMVITFVVMPFVEEIEAIPTAVGLALTLLFHTLIASYAIWILWRHRQKLLERRLTLLNLLLEGAIAFGVWIVVMFTNLSIGCLWAVFGGEPVELPDEFQEIIRSQSVAILLFVAMLTCLWAPVSEELFFRRMLLRSLQGRLPLWGALLLQAALFTALHSYYVGIQFAPIFVLGLALGGLYAWRRTILSSMMLHAIQNTFATTIIGLLMWGTARAPVLGIEMETVEEGVQVVDVIPNSAAEEAGLQEGDVITAIRLGGWFAQPGVPYQPVTDDFTLKFWLMLQSAGYEVHLTILRDGEPIDIAVILQNRDDLDLKQDAVE